MHRAFEMSDLEVKSPLELKPVRHFCAYWHSIIVCILKNDIRCCVS